MVVGVFQGTAAAELASGGLIETGDTIEAVGGVPVRSSVDVINSIRSRAPGDLLGLRLRRHDGAALVMLEAELGWISGDRFRQLR